MSWSCAKAFSYSSLESLTFSFDAGSDLRFDREVADAGGDADGFVTVDVLFAKLADRGGRFTLLEVRPPCGWRCWRFISHGQGEYTALHDNVRPRRYGSQGTGGFLHEETNRCEETLLSKG